ncbi:MAG TPA: glycine cleavage T C-terminal barrel domain-containing protein [Candidatus Binataceae bacterium]
MPEDYAAISRSAGVFCNRDRQLVRMIGDDRVTFLHGMCSNDIKNAKPGTVVPALFLTEHAHVIADFFAWILDDAILIDIDRTLWPRAREHLEKLLVADDVEFEERESLRVIEVAGPQARIAIRAFANDPEPVAPIEPWRFVKAGDLLLGDFPRRGTSSVSIIAPDEKTGSIVASITSRVPDAREVGAEVLEIARIEQGMARAGVDTSEKSVALEARLNRAISLNKGCYVGQETVERVTSRGGLKKRLFGLRFADRRVAERGAAIALDGKQVGHVTSAVLSPRLGAIGLAILSYSAWAPGTVVQIEGGAGGLRATVAEIPFDEH